MIVNGVEVLPSTEQSLESWMKTHTEKSGFRASDLVQKIKEQGVQSLMDDAVSMRVADRLLQKHKKLRNIRLFGANNWCWVGAY